jgi:predicted nucleic acid-binding protein
MAVQSKKIFIASDAFFAFVDRAHPKHEQADAYFRYFAQEESLLFTDIHSVMETYKKIYTDISPSLSKDFLRTMALSSFNVIYPEESDFKAALKTLINYQVTDLTFHQALVAALANRRGISQIFTFEYLHPLFGQSAYYLPL